MLWRELTLCQTTLLKISTTAIGCTVALFAGADIRLAEKCIELDK